MTPAQLTVVIQQVQQANRAAYLRKQKEQRIINKALASK